MSKVSIAIFGLHGFLGEPVLEAINSGKFDSKISYPIKAITRKSDLKNTEKIEYISIPEIKSTESKLISELKGVDVLIELTGPNPQVFSEIEKIVEAVKPKLVIPSQFGTDIDQVDTYAPGFLALKSEHSANLRKVKGVKVVDIITSLFIVPGKFLYDWVGAVGITDNGINVIGDLNQKINVSTLADIGNTVLAVSTFKPVEDLPDVLRISSDTITVQDVINQYSKRHNKDLKILTTISAEEGKKQFQDKLKAGFNPDDFFFYLQVIIAQGLDKGLLFSKLDNELINPGESVWKWGKYEK
ncbi:uncharacterized protein KGF55_004947 [Candida pseudojiufengensis]|uniref:uncharacterized protein n=1 Tax=Candida pseudojiufengensis TaxID=497109 RepID=UPI002224E0A8|nr:uncharacterized protein KGF55_004947 [Candida pseudojiufengensis]KAI5959715.1 hypothetical protein KGF55_004947 [Candida pseudojiufengensis]